MNEKLKRVQMLIKPEQHRTLAEIAHQQGKSIAEVTRTVIDLGLVALEKEDEFNRRKDALERANRLRQKMHQARGKPLDIDVALDLAKIREEHDDQLTDSSD